jgi:hypothetical protein
MNLNASAAEQVGLLAVVDPVSQAAGPNATVWVPTANYHQFLAIVQTGVLGAGATIDAKVQQAKDSTGLNAKDISGESITQIPKVSGDNKQVMISVRSESLDQTNGYDHIGIVLGVGVAPSIVSAVLLGIGPRYLPPLGNTTSLVQSV